MLDGSAAHGLALAACLVLLSATASGRVAADAGPDDPLPVPRGYVCYRATSPVAVDGKLDEAAWEAAPWTEEFVDIEGDLKPKPASATRARMLWDDDYLYIGARLEEPHIWATLTEHDSVIFQDPDFEVFIDPDGDTHEYYEIEVNALGTEWDLRLVKPYKDGGPALNEWEIPGLKLGVHIEGTLNDPSDTDEFWSVEMALPWDVLGEFAKCPSPPRPGDQWRLGFSRVEWDIEIVDGHYRKIPDRAEHNWIWSPQGLIDMHRPETWGYVQFSEMPPGEDSFRRDPCEPVRMLLFRAYYLQRAHRNEQGEWATDIAELGLAGLAGRLLDEPPAIRLTPEGYEITATCAEGQRLHVRQDSLYWED